MDEETFDIFSGDPEEQGFWVAAVSGLSNARQLMARRAEETPGKYFLFSGSSQHILSRMQTFEKNE